MNARAVALVVAALLAFGCRGLHASTPTTPDDASRQVLLMLRAPAQHVRPDAGYTGDYGQAPGHAARARIARRLAKANGLSLRTDWPMPALGLDCYVLEARDASAVAPAVAALARDPRVESVQAMQAFETLSDAASDTARPTPADPLAAAQPARAAWQLDALHARTTGRGVTVAVIDSGIADAHPDLRGQIAAHRDFVDTDAARVVPERHGTAVAGLIAARAGNRIGIAGVAPDAKLLALRACWQRGGSQATSGDRAQCNTFTLAKALQFAIDRRAQVVNMSLGGPPDVLLSRLLAVAMQRGATVVAAVDPQSRAGGFPASVPGVVAVSGDTRALPFVAYLAPASELPTTTVDGGWGLVTGTSFAAAEVSGLVALLRQVAPRLPSARVHDALGAAPALGSTATRPLSIDACAAVTRAGSGCACGCRLADSQETPRH